MPVQKDSSAPDFEALTPPAILRLRAARQGDRLAYTFLSDGETEEVRLTYAELDLRARAIGATLKSLGASGKRALLLYPPGLEYIAALFGCFYAGAVAVPVYPPRLNRHLHRLQTILTDAQADLALTDARSLSRLESLFDQLPELRRVRLIATDEISELIVNDWQAVVAKDDSLALLQYTSGSTGAPRGVMLSHRNLAHNSALLARAFEYTTDSLCVSWLPIYHDMGLIGGVLQPLYGGFPCVLMSPAAFLQRPFRWLRAISEYRATLSGGPNFAYELCARRVTGEQRESLDLSSWSVAFNGAEPLRAATLENFTRTFAPCGFNSRAFYPCYGLAEATLIVSGGPKSGQPVVKTVDAILLESGRAVEASADADVRARPLVGSGQIVKGERVVVVNPQTLSECLRGEVGEIWVAGESVAEGYWNRPEETAATFRARLSGAREGAFLRTGDLGFVEDGELFITGRLKDLIIIRGRNHYPQDIELSVETSDPALRHGAGAAFSIETEEGERLVIVQELELRKLIDFDSVIRHIRQAVAEQHELQAHAVVLLRPGSIPKTSSGKIQRHACHDAFLANSLDGMAEWRESVATTQIETPTEVPKPASPDRENIEAYLTTLLAARLGLDGAAIDKNQSVASYGLDSLGAIELAHRIESGLGVRIEMQGLLEGHSIAALASEIRARLKEPLNETQAVLTAKGAENSSPLSHGQRALWYLQQTSPDSVAYNLACALRIRGDLNRRALRQAVKLLVERHPSLRTSYSAAHGEPSQTVHREPAIDFVEEDASRWSEASLTERVNEEAQRPFDLERAPPVRIRLFERSEGEHTLLLAAHHIALDFWSLGILMRELTSLYRAENAHEKGWLDSLELQYADFVRWQSGMLAGGEGRRLWAYWEKQLAGDLPALNLPPARPRPPVQTYRGAAVRFQLDFETLRGLKSLARQHGATLYMLLLAAFQVLLHRYTNQETIAVGTTTAGRIRAELAGLVGYFVNPLVMRGNFSDNPTFAAFLARMRRTALEAFAHQDYPFPLLVERLQVARDASRSPLFQAMFVLHQAQRPEEDCMPLLALGEATPSVKIDGLEIEAMALEQVAAQFDLTLALAETKDKLDGAFQYNTDLFDAEMIGAMVEHFRTLLEGISADSHRRVSELPLLAEAERRKIVREWNDTSRAFASEKTIHRLLEEQVERTPEAVALVAEDGQLSYRELNRRANRMARHLRTLGVGTEKLVGLLMERSTEMVVALLATLKAGGAYVPLDTAHPPERLALMLEDAGIEVLLTERRLADKISAAGNMRIVYVDAGREQFAQHGAENLESAASADNLAYVIYTSGSTGRPKGVMISHRSLVNYLCWCVEAYDVRDGNGAPVHSSIGFDLTVTSLFAPLLAGRSVVLSAAQGGEALTSALRLRGDYSFIKLTPSHFSVLGEAVAAEKAEGLTKMLILGGEALRGETVRRWREHSPATRIINEYGPTETVVGCCVYEVTEGSKIGDAVPIGRPVANTHLYILDEHLNPLPAGFTGELYIGGVGLARGYLNSPDLTASKFIPHPYSREGGARLYRTGDRVRYLPDGNIEFLGRFDEQIKLRGYRVELGEIEAVLREHPSIRDAVVVVDENAQRLSAYFVAANSQTPVQAELRRHLKAKLPEYMVPASLSKLDEIPLTANGKVDRKALGSMAHERPEISADLTAPRTETERTLAEIWAQVLDIRRVGVHDNFFELGGHSLIATQIIARSRDAFGVELPLSTFLKSPTIAQLAGAIDEARNSGAATRRSKIVPTSRAHRRWKPTGDGATTDDNLSSE